MKTNLKKKKDKEKKECEKKNSAKLSDFPCCYSNKINVKKFKKR